MITLYTFGPAFGLPDISPFVTKAEVLLKMAGLPYEKKRADVRKAPKKKLPYIRDEDGTVVADSTLIRFHLERQYGIDLDAHLSPAERGIAWAIEKLCEDHLYWVAMRERWLIDENFQKGPRRFFEIVPMPMRPIVRNMVRRQVRRTIWGQGLGRHTPDELAEITKRGLQAIADVLGDKQFLMGDSPCAEDATVFAFTLGVLTPYFDTPTRALAAEHANLIAYRDRGLARWFPDFSANAAS